jgi:4-carboxymuconolactone decarboxylase
MRLKFVKPENLTAEQKPLYDDMKTGIKTNFKGFQAIEGDGTLIGPWNPWIQFPKIGGPMWELVKALSMNPTLPKPVREIAILVTGASFHSGYELYAHVLMAELRGLDDDTIATIVSGQRPSNLKDEESVAYDVASSLQRGGVLPELVYKKAVEHFGEEGAAELIYLVGLYCMVSVTLNGFDVPVPE